MEFLDIGLSLLLHAPHNFSTGGILKKTALYSGLKNRYKKSVKSIFVERKYEGRKPDKTRVWEDSVYAQKPRQKMPSKNSISLLVTVGFLNFFPEPLLVCFMSSLPELRALLSSLVRTVCFKKIFLSLPSPSSCVIDFFTVHVTEISLCGWKTEKKYSSVSSFPPLSTTHHYLLYQ